MKAFRSREMGLFYMDAAERIMAHILWSQEKLFGQNFQAMLDCL
jgi:hypothetical protein